MKIQKPKHRRKVVDSHSFIQLISELVLGVELSAV